jgi:hypothetical protein
MDITLRNEAKGSTLLRNVSNHLPDHTVSKLEHNLNIKFA